MRTVDRQIDRAAMAHSAFSDDVIGELLHIGTAPLEHCYLHAALVVEVDV